MARAMRPLSPSSGTRSARARAREASRASASSRRPSAAFQASTAGRPPRERRASPRSAAAPSTERSRAMGMSAARTLAPSARRLSGSGWRERDELELEREVRVGQDETGIPLLPVSERARDQELPLLSLLHGEERLDPSADEAHPVELELLGCPALAGAHERLPVREHAGVVHEHPGAEGRGLALALGQDLVLEPGGRSHESLSLFARARRSAGRSGLLR